MENKIVFFSSRENESKRKRKVIILMMPVLTLIAAGFFYYKKTEQVQNQLVNQVATEDNKEEPQSLSAQLLHAFENEEDKIISPDLDSDSDGIKDLEEVSQGLNPKINEEVLASNANLSACDKDKGAYVTATVQGSAIGSKDVNLEPMSLYDACLINVAEGLDNVYICEKIPDNHSMYGLCYSVFAGKRKNLSLCSKIPNNNGHKSVCYRNVAVETLDVAVCDKIITVESIREKRKQEEISQCYQTVAIRKNDPAFCNLMNNDESKAMCYSYFGIKTNAIELCIKAGEFTDGMSKISADHCVEALAFSQKNESYCDHMSSMDKNKYFPDGRCRYMMDKIKSGKASCHTPSGFSDPNFMRPEAGISCKVDK